MKKTIAIAATFVVALFLTFYFTGGMFSPSTPVVQTYWLTRGDTVESFNVSGYENFTVTAVDTAFADTIFVTVSGSGEDGDYPTSPTALHDISGTTLTTLTGGLTPGVNGTATGIIPVQNGSKIPVSWIKVSRKNTDNAGTIHRTKIIVKGM